MNRIYSLLVVFFIGAGGIPINRVECSTAMKRLYEELFTDYNRLILPVANNKTKVTVTLGLKLGQILDLNLKQQILSTNVWVEQSWHDYKLQWSPEQYEGIDMIHVPAENIWIPDIVLFNNADGNYELTLVAKARVYSNGTVAWRPPTMFRSTCEIDVEYFPFDIQTCFLRFGSWTYAGDELELRHVANKKKAEIGIDLSQFYKNVEWDIIDVPAYYNENYYECCQEPFPDITFKIVIRRKMLFYLVNLILPVALMTFMTVSVFYLPSDSNEKVTLSISILTSLIVFFLLMLEIIPASSLAVPLFGKYLLFTLVLVSLSACLSVYVLNIHHRSPAVHSMSPKMRKIFLDTLPRLLRLNRPDPHERSSLNRFRKKKIAQQLLNNSAAGNKVYDLAQPLATSLNLIETLHKSYDFNPKDDESGPSAADDEGRYFRRYVDNYIDRLKRLKEHEQVSGGVKTDPSSADCGCESRRTMSCCEHQKCCSNRSLPGRRHPNGCCGPRGSNKNNNQGTMDWTESSADMMCPLVRQSKLISLEESSAGVCKNCATGSRSMRHQTSVGGKSGTSCSTHLQNPHASANPLGMLNDDTLDMTFDYDYDQDNYSDGGPIMNLNGRCSAGGMAQQPPTATVGDEELPSPPPPPRQLTHLSDSMQNKSTGRLSSCSRNITSNSSDDLSCSGKPLEDHGQLVDKLLNSINLINNASDEIDTTTLSSENTATDREDLAGRKPFDEPVSPFVSADGLPIGEKQQLRKRQQLSSMAQSSRQSDREIPFGPSGVHQHMTSGDSRCLCNQNSAGGSSQQRIRQTTGTNREDLPAGGCSADIKQPSDLLMSLRLPYDQMPAHVRAAIRSILFIADTIKNEDDENSAIEDWESMSMVVDRLFLWIFFLLCTFGSVIILALAPSLYDKRESIDDLLRLDIPLSNCSAGQNLP